MQKTVIDIKSLKGIKKIVAVTAYDSTMAQLFDKANVDILLVGDSAGMVMMGQDSTQKVKMQDMCLFTASVSAIKPKALVVADMPIDSCKPDTKTAIVNAKRLYDAGARAVKLEGGTEIIKHVQGIIASGIPVMGHIGFLPQTGATNGTSKKYGMEKSTIEKLVNDACTLESAGAFAIVLEMTSCEAAFQISQSVKIPTIGIGSGPSCDGQILVTHDLLGMYERIKPSFAKRYRNLANEITSAVSEYKQDVESGEFPASEHGFSMESD